MKISKISGKDCKTTRSLWEEVFYEDSVQFTDYYFENKAEKNIGYVIGEAPYDAMMFRTPYRLQIGKEQQEISYLVGVATRKECRHRGLMRRLLMHSFQEMYEEKQPFTFLMPANPAIYEPFDFRYVYERDVWQLKETAKTISRLESLTKGKDPGEKSELRAAQFDGRDCDFNKSQKEITGLYSVRNLMEHTPQIPIMDMLVAFSNEYLEEHYQIYVRRDKSYYEMQLIESEAQNGDIYVLLEQGEIKAFFLYAKEGDEVFIQEVMEKEEGTLDFLQKEEKKKPIIMARIIHLEEMLKLVCSKEDKNLLLKIEDDLIPENDGIYRWEIMPNESKVIKLQEEKSWKEMEEDYENRSVKSRMIAMHIRELAAYILTGVFINEIV